MTLRPDEFRTLYAFLFASWRKWAVVDLFAGAGQAMRAMRAMLCERLLFGFTCLGEHLATVACYGAAPIRQDCGKSRKHGSTVFLSETQWRGEGDRSHFSATHELKLQFRRRRGCGR
ncbi:MAG: hypothetical protein DMF06_12340 [Verrucomicrobia bacterium]|nr:MAG: hypothetical protein DMF06_12340 [Verrucomicrobiota bacterium]